MQTVIGATEDSCGDSELQNERTQRVVMNGDVNALVIAGLVVMI